jgi:hypothetical protein
MAIFEHWVKHSNDLNRLRSFVLRAGSVSAMIGRSDCEVIEAIDEIE